MAKIHPLFPPTGSSPEPSPQADAHREAHPRLSRAQLQAAVERIPRAAGAPTRPSATLHVIPSQEASAIARPFPAGGPSRVGAPGPEPRSTRGAGPQQGSLGPDPAGRPAAGIAALQATLDRIAHTAAEPPADRVPVRHPAADAPRRRADSMPLFEALSARAATRPPSPARTRPADRVDAPPPTVARGAGPVAPSLALTPGAGFRGDTAADAGARAGVEDMLAVIAEQNRAAQDRLLQAEVMLNRVERIARDGDERAASAPSRARRLLRVALDLNVTLGVLLICSFWLGPPAALRMVGYGMWAVGAYLLMVAIALAWCGGVEDLVERTARAFDHPRLAPLRRMLPAARSSGRAAADALVDFTLWAGAAEGVFLCWFLTARSALP